MSGVPVDQHVRDLIRTRTHENMLVEAGAGTGKTTTLVARVVEVLRTGRASVDQIVVMTFTEKAAGELSAKIRERLERMLDDVDSRGRSGSGAPERRRIHAAIAGLGRARIETIHAFCTTLLRNRPIEAGLDPQFRILDAFAAELDFETRFRSWFEDIMARPPRPLLVALRRGLRLHDLERLARDLNGYRECLPLPGYELVPLDVQDFVAGFCESVRQLAELAQKCTRTDDKAVVATAEFQRVADELQARVNDAVAVERCLLDVSPTSLTTNRGQKQNWPDGCLDEHRRLRSDLRAALGDAQARLRAEALCAAAPLVQDFVRSAAGARRDAGVLSFHDLLVATRDLLRMRPEVAAECRSHYRVVFIDEFQDTDPLQVEIARLLTSGDATSVPPPGSFFAVGDPKQSIYRFRRADIAMYDAVKSSLFGHGSPRSQVQVINQNFRSAPAVLDWVNATFGELIEPTHGVQPDYVELAADDTARFDGGVHVFAGTREAQSSGEARDSEAAVLAEVLTRIIGEGWIVRDPQSQSHRPARLDDIAILMPRRTQIERYERALEARGITYRQESGRAFFNRPEVREFLSVLSAIADPTDTFAVFRALRSQAFSCSDDDILRHVGGAGALDYRHVPDRPGPVAASLAVLSDLHEMADTQPLAAFLDYVLRATHMAVAVLTLPGGVQVAANLGKVVDQARTFGAVTGGGLRAFVDWLSVHVEEDADGEDAVVAEADGDVVRIFTMHAAKGLEFPIVVLANLNGSARSNPTVVADRADGTLHLKAGRRGSEFLTPGAAAALQLERNHSEAEARRLLYVAATRARDHLVIPYAHKAPGPEGLLAELLPHLPDPELVQAAAAHVTSPSDDATPTKSGATAWTAAETSWLAERQTLLAAARRPFRVVAPSSAETWTPDASAWTPRPAGSAGDARAIGSATHRVLETIPFDADAEMVIAYADAAAQAERIPETAGDVAALVSVALELPITRRAAASPTALRECDLAVAYDEDTAVEGRMDLVIRDARGLVVVDYKTDAIDRASIDRRVGVYRNQAALYADALRRATAFVPDVVVFAFLRPGIERVIPVDDELLRAANAVVANPTTG